MSRPNIRSRGFRTSRFRAGRMSRTMRRNRKCAEVIRALMRMDPDDVTVGEIRDRVVAGLVAELALTGHPVRTSLHADSAIGAFMRLAGGRLQLPMDEVSSEKFINAVGNQKLIPLLCPHCKRPAEDVMPAEHLTLLRTKFGLDTSKMACRDEDGCEHCRLPGLFTRAGQGRGWHERADARDGTVPADARISREGVCA